MIRPRKILCPLDFSAGSKEALQRTADIAIKNQSEVVLVHVATPQTWIGMSDVPISGDVVQQMVDDEHVELDGALAELLRLGVATATSRMLAGSPAEAIVGAIEVDPAIDLVVMGTHGRTGIRHAVLGSVAEKVVRFAPCDVLVTRPRR
jgi:nucleotide-binding universal stress UspA family protein